MSASSLMRCLPGKIWQERPLWMKSREYVCLDLVCRGGIGSVGPDLVSSSSFNELCQCAVLRASSEL